MVTKKVFDPQCITYSQMNLIFNSRIYYRRLTAWTRAYILSRYFGIGTAEELFGRLYLESLDIGNMLKIIFGREAAEQYSQMVSEFAIAFRDLLSAQLEGNEENINRNVERLYRNVEERAEFLAAMNPYWNAEDYENLFDTYIQLILREANAIAAEDYSGDIALYELLTAHTNRMGDVFAQGLYDYITSGARNGENFQSPPEGTECVTYDQMNEIYEIRMYWFELVTWVRSYMLSRYLGLGNADQVYARLNQVPVDYVNRLERILGYPLPEEYLGLLQEYIQLIDAFITAQMEGNEEQIGEITRLLYQNADARAAAAAVNLFVDEEAARVRIYNNLRATIDESTSFLARDYARNIDIFSRLVDQAESISNWFGRGVFDYIIANQSSQ